MYRFYVDDNCIYDDRISITGPDVNHIRNVLRMTQGGHIIVNDKAGTDYYCDIDSVDTDEVTALITDKKLSEAELPVKLYLFQALPKLDKMELIIQKAVELGVYEIIPVETKRCVVKLDKGTKQQKKLARWQTIAEAAAKQTALARVPGATAANLYKFELDFDDGRWEYEGEIRYGTTEYDFTIDANTGAILKWDMESIYD